MTAGTAILATWGVRARTPHIDEMAGSSLLFTRFYAQAPVCRPTRGSALTGRHPFRYGILHANTGHLPELGPNLAVMLRDRGYRTGMIGKWHLGTLTTTVTDANRGRPGNTADFAPQWLRGFDVCFATESKVPTYHPMVRPRDFADHPDNLKDWWDPEIPPEIPPENRQHYGTRYWDGQGREVTEDLDGPNSRIIMDRAIPFIRAAAEAGEPFLAVTWFHEPHLPVVAGPEVSAAFAGLDPFVRHYHGCITAADREVGRLRAELRRLGIVTTSLRIPPKAAISLRKCREKSRPWPPKSIAGGRPSRPPSGAQENQSLLELFAGSHEDWPTSQRNDP